MSAELALVLAFGIGVVAGLRALTAPAVVAWAAHWGWLELGGSWLAWMGTLWAVGLLTVAALAELIADQLPKTPARTSAPALTIRILMGLLTGACLGGAGGVALWLAAIVGALGALAGAFGGYQARVRLVRKLQAPDYAIATPEDVLAIGLGLLLVSRF